MAPKAVDEANMSTAGRHFNKIAAEDAEKKETAKVVDEANMSTAGRHFNKIAAEGAEKKAEKAAKGVDEANMTMAGRHFNKIAAEEAEKKSSAKVRSRIGNMPVRHWTLLDKGLSDFGPRARSRPPWTRPWS